MAWGGAQIDYFWQSRARTHKCESVTTTCLMSALSHFADSSRTFREVREVPIPAVSRCSSDVRGSRLFDHLVGAGEHGRRHGKAERLGGLQVDNEFVLGRGLHRQVTRLLALED